MKNFFKRHNSNPSITNVRSGSWLIAAFLLFAALNPHFSLGAHAQRLYGPVRISSISAQTSSNGTVVKLSADNALTRAQTWQDDEGYHLVLPNTVSADSVKAVRGVKLRRIGSSLEVLLQTKPGARVTAQSSHNHLNLIVDSKLIARPSDSYFPVDSASSEERRLFDDSPDVRSEQETEPLKFSSTVEDLSSNSSTTESQAIQATSTPAATTDAAPTQTSSNQIVPQGDGTAAPEPPAQIRVQAEEDSLLASVFSGTSVFIVLALGLFGLLVSRKIRSKQQVTPVNKATAEQAAALDDLEGLEAQNHPAALEPGKSLVRTREMPSNGASRQAVVRMPVAGPTSLYGAYRIDQEVCKLILGQPHRIDVLASRAIDNRRAVEASLIKAINSSEADDSAQRRGREALEEYGFVARQCATLLLAPDAFDRSSAARSLGEIKSAAALPFLLESLYDSEAIVRNQAVVSIGELKLPSAIGALLDIARTHPEVPSGLLTRALSACSVEGLDFFDAALPDASLLGPGDLGGVIEEITHLEPSTSVEDLPDTSDDERLTHALSSICSHDDEERSEALKTLGNFRVQSAVEAIRRTARNDAEPAIRSLAISSLGSINHESVFPAILVGMADESREVRAAAARSLNRLSFDRADAYVRVIETEDDETIRAVAKACIQAGIVSQNLDRLTNSDHRQAYETFSLICLLAKAGMNEPVVQAIAEHPRMDVRLKAIHLFASTGHPHTLEQLRALAINDGVSEAVKTALLEAMYKLDQATAKHNQPDGGIHNQFGEIPDVDFLQRTEETNAAPILDQVEADEMGPIAHRELEQTFEFEPVQSPDVESEDKWTTNMDEYEL
jgi:HEAT repeat protein